MYKSFYYKSDMVLVTVNKLENKTGTVLELMFAQERDKNKQGMCLHPWPNVIKCQGAMRVTIKLQSEG